MKELKLFKLDDGELWWVAHYTLEDAIDDAMERYAIGEFDRPTGELVPMNEIMDIYLPDGYHELERDKYPVEPYYDDDKCYVRATVKEFLSVAKAGDMIATTLC